MAPLNSKIYLLVAIVVLSQAAQSQTRASNSPKNESFHPIGEESSSSSSSKKVENEKLEPEHAESKAPSVISPAIGTTVTGVVRIIRANPETEVFFKDIKDSVIISKDSHHNQAFEACELSMKKGTPVSLQIDPRSRRVLSVAEIKAAPAAPASPAASGSPSANTPGVPSAGPASK